MRLFVCWSGRRSGELAKALQCWLPKVVPELGCLFISEDIEKGSDWLERVQNELESADAALICLTPENLRSGWIHFEAGAIAHRLTGNPIYTYLYEVQPADLTGPLAAFQYTLSTKVDTRRLVDSIAMHAGGRDARTTAMKQFEAGWDELAALIERIAPLPLSELFDGLPALFERKTFREPIEKCTTQDWVGRYTGASDTLRVLRDKRALVHDHGHPYLGFFYDELMAMVDHYAMHMSALLLKPERYELTDAGSLEIPVGVRQACERGREKIHELVTLLRDTSSQPALKKRAIAFERANTFPEKKQAVHELECDLPKLGKELRRCATSWWTLDRIAYYLVLERRKKPPVGALLNAVELELERAGAKGPEASLVALHYAVRGLKRSVSKGKDGERVSDIERLVAKVRAFLETSQKDTGGQIRANLRELEEELADTSAKGAPSPPVRGNFA